MAVAQEIRRMGHPMLTVRTEGLDIRPFESKLYEDSVKKCEELFKLNKIDGMDSTRGVFEIY